MCSRGGIYKVPQLEGLSSRHTGIHEPSLCQLSAVLGQEAPTKPAKKPAKAAEPVRPAEAQPRKSHGHAPHATGNRKLCQVPAPAPVPQQSEAEAEDAAGDLKAQTLPRPPGARGR